MMGKAETGV